MVRKKMKLKKISIENELITKVICQKKNVAFFSEFRMNHYF